MSPKNIALMVLLFLLMVFLFFGLLHNLRPKENLNEKEEVASFLKSGGRRDNPRKLYSKGLTTVTTKEFQKENRDFELLDETVGNEDTKSSSSKTEKYLQNSDPNSTSILLPPGECTLSPDGFLLYLCPSPTANGNWICIEDYQLCNKSQDCPNADDESHYHCLFYKALKSSIDLLAERFAELSLEKGRGRMNKHEHGRKPWGNFMG